MWAQKGINGEIVRREFAKGTSRHWLIPPEIYQKLDSEFHFTFDPFPYPRLEGWDALRMDWGSVNFVNPPFIHDGKTGPIDYLKKAIDESEKGRTSVITWPVRSGPHLLLMAGAEVRPLGRVRWLDVITKKPMGAPNLVAAFILRGKNGRERNE